MFWYHHDVEVLVSKPVPETLKKKIAFYGSSTIRLWENLESDFEPKYCAINLGFGGSTLAACAWFFEKIMLKFQPDAIIIYAGDNDLGDNRHPEEIYNHFLALIYKIRMQYVHIPVTFISIKPSPARWHINDRIHYTNKIIFDCILEMDNVHFLDIYSQMIDSKPTPIREYYLPDGLHLSKKGYKIWKNLVSAHISNIMDK